jgi:hypothetical protein
MNQGDMETAIKETISYFGLDNYEYDSYINRKPKEISERERLLLELNKIERKYNDKNDSKN